MSKPSYTRAEMKAFEAQLTPCKACGGTNIGIYGPCDTDEGWVWDIMCDMPDPDYPSCPIECLITGSHLSLEKAIASWNAGEAHPV